MVAGQSNKLVAVIQARMQSSRLPGKVLMPMPLTGTTSILGQIINQLKSSNNTLDIIIATSKCEADDKLAEFALTENIQVYRGEEEDVHSRFFDVLNNSKYDIAIRVTGDNPLLDSFYLDYVIEKHIESSADYSFTEDLPLGMNFEVFNVSSFLKMSKMQLSKEEKEHVTLKLKLDPSFTKNYIRIDPNIDNLIRVTVDYPSDYLMVSSLFQLADIHGLKLGLEVIKYAVIHYPWLFNVNNMNVQKKQFSSLEEEVQYVIGILRKMEINRVANYLSSNFGI